MKENRGIWTGIIIILVLAVLTAWWISASQPLNTLLTNSTSAVADSSDATTSATAKLAAQGVARGNVRHITHDDVASIVANLAGASEFNALFRTTGIASTIGAGAANRYTIFVPVNRAVDQLPKGSITSLSSAEKKRLVQYHVVSGRAIDLTAQSAGQIQSLSGDTVNFMYQGNTPIVNSSRILAQYEGSNGVVYVIDSVLLPPQKPTM